MRRHGLLASILLAAPSLAMAATASTAARPAYEALVPSSKPQRSRKKRNLMIAGGFKLSRSKGAPPKRKLKPNMNHVSRRVRRKHRRARN